MRFEAPFFARRSTRNPGRESAAHAHANWATLLLAILAAAGCTPPPDPARDLHLKDLIRTRIERHSEWRSAWKIPAGERQAVNLGPIPSGGVLRLGILEGELAGERPVLSVYAGEQCVAKIRTGRKAEWGSYRIPFDAGVAGETCRAVFGTSTPLWVGPCEVAGAPVHTPNVLIFLIDTLRRDHLSCYGYLRKTSPNIDALARDAVLLTDVLPQSSWTKPSVASLFTSAYPAIHGARDRPDVMREGLPSFVEVFEAQGYENLGFITNSNILPIWGFGGGFHRYVNIATPEVENYDDAIPVNAAIEALPFLEGRPWLLYVHALGPHEPYEPPAGYAAHFKREDYPDDPQAAGRMKAVDLYDSEIAYTDMQFGRLTAALRERGLYEDSLIILVSDHGEELWEHGQGGHGKTLYEESLRVPLIVKLPGQAYAGARRTQLVELVDIAPTLLDLLGWPPEPRFRGRSIAPLLKGRTLEDRPAFASLVYDAWSLRAAKTADKKYIRNIGEQWEHWFDLAADPKELAPAQAPIPGSEILAGHAARIAMIGQGGLHVLMTCGAKPRTVTGTIQGSDLGEYELHYYDWKGSAAREGDSLRFEWMTKHTSDHFYSRDRWHGEIAEQDHAHLRVATPPSAPLRIVLRVDGEAAEPEHVHLSAHASVPTSGELKIVPIEVAQEPDAYDPAGLPREFGLYIWYVPDAGAVDLATLDPGMRQVLKALGYLD